MMKMYCPDCKKMTECKVVTSDLMSEAGLGAVATYRTASGKEILGHDVKDERRFTGVKKISDSEYEDYKPYHSSTHGIHYYARCRFCEECEESGGFWTVELDKNSFEESIAKPQDDIGELRSEVDRLRPTASEMSNLHLYIETIIKADVIHRKLVQKYQLRPGEDVIKHISLLQELRSSATEIVKKMEIESLEIALRRTQGNEIVDLLLEDAPNEGEEFIELCHKLLAHLVTIADIKLSEPNQRLVEFILDITTSIRGHKYLADSMNESVEEYTEYLLEGTE